jgi:putative ABC transport system permease protein
VARDTYDFPIVGLTERSEFGGGPGFVQNDVLIPPGPARRIKKLPITSIWDVFRMSEGRTGYSAVSVKLGSLGDLDAVRARVREMGFSTFALADQFDEIRKGFYFMDMMLAAVGMIAIVVAALGIVNTMVMSILERTREIGVMKAVGAGDGDIKRIFFFESGAIGLLGGAAGRPRRSRRRPPPRLGLDILFARCGDFSRRSVRRTQRQNNSLGLR